MRKLGIRLIQGSLVLLIVSLLACGQKGPLYHPSADNAHNAHAEGL